MKILCSFLSMGLCGWGIFYHLCPYYYMVLEFKTVPVIGMHIANYIQMSMKVMK